MKELFTPNDDKKQQKKQNSVNEESLINIKTEHVFKLLFFLFRKKFTEKIKKRF